MTRRSTPFAPVLFLALATCAAFAQEPAQPKPPSPAGDAISVQNSDAGTILVATDHRRRTLAIYGTDGDEQILGKDTKDIVYPLMGADLVRTGLGDDSVLVYFSSGGDTAGDWSRSAGSNNELRRLARDEGIRQRRHRLQRTRCYGTGPQASIYELREGA